MGVGGTKGVTLSAKVKTIWLTWSISFQFIFHSIFRNFQPLWSNTSNNCKGGYRGLQPISCDMVSQFCICGNSEHPGGKGAAEQGCSLMASEKQPEQKEGARVTRTATRACPQWLTSSTMSYLLKFPPRPRAPSLGMSFIMQPLKDI